MLFLDRFENDIALIECEDENGTVSVIKEPRQRISADVREGEAVKLENGIYKTDIELTEQRRKQIREKLKNMLK